MLIHPDIDPVIVALGPVKVHWYGFMYVLAFISAYLLATYRARIHREAGDFWNSEMVSDTLFYGALGVMLGGRIGYVIFYEFDKFLANPLWLFRVWEGGMSFHGGFIGVMLAMLLFARKYRKSPMQVLDFIAPCVPLGLFFGRIGNFINGELWGRVSAGGQSWLMAFPTAAPFDDVAMQNNPALQALAQPVQGMLLLPRHPSQLYQAVCEGLLLFILLWWYSSKPRPRMAVSAVFLLGYGAARFLMEYFREPDADQGFFLGGLFTKGQLLTIPMLLIGAWMLWYAYRRNRYDWGPSAGAVQ